MRKTIAFLLLLTAFFACHRVSWAADPSSTDLGLSADNAQVSGKDADEVNKYSVGFQRALRIIGKDWYMTILARVWEFLGNIAIKLMFYVYDNYIGSFLIYIPDMANQATYQRAGAPDGAGAAHVVNAILQVSRAIGFWFLLVLSAANIAQGASGLSNITFTGRHIVRVLTCFILMCAWAPIFSLLTQLFTAIGYSFYTSCNLNTGGVLSALSSFSLSSTAAASSTSLASVASSSRSVLINYTGIVWNVVYVVAIALVVIGVIAGTLKFSGGDRQGFSKIIVALLGLITILALPWAFNSMVRKGLPYLGSSTASETSGSYNLFSATESFSGSAKPILPSIFSGPTSSSSSASTTDSLTAAHDTTTTDNATEYARGAAGIFKVLMSIWGLFIVVGILFMKFSQIILLGVLFMLGPIFIGLAAHPVTTSISMGALRLLIKLLAYSPMWALTLVFLYLLPNVDFGVANMGVNSLMTAFAVFAGLQIVSDAKDIAGLFSNFGGLAGGGNIQAQSPFKVMAGGFLGASGQAQGIAKHAGSAASLFSSATPQGAAATAATTAARMALKKTASSASSGAKAGGGGLSPSSDVSPKNMDNYVSMMNTQPASQSNIDQIGRVIAGRAKGNNAPQNDEKANQLRSIQNRMKNQMGGK